MTRAFIAAWAFIGILWSPAARAQSDSPPADVEPEAENTDAPEPDASGGPEARPPTVPQPAPPATPPDASQHVGGMVGAAVGAAVPIAVAGAFGAISLFYQTPDNTFVGNEAILKFTVAPIATIAALGVLPLTSAAGTLLGLALEMGLQRSLLPALAAGLAAPVGGVGGAVVLGLVGAALGGLVAPIVVAAAGSGTIYDLALLFLAPIAGGAIGLVVGAAGGAVAGPIAVVYALDRIFPASTEATEAE